MKIVYLSASTVPSRNANSVHVMKMCRSFAANGHEVTLVTQDRSTELVDADDPFRFYGIRRDFSLRSLPWFGFPGRSYAYGIMAARLAARLRPDVAYGRSLSACYAATLLRLPVVYEAHQPIARAGLRGWMFRRMIEAPSFRYIVTISDALRGMLESEFPQLVGRIRVAHDGADDPGDAEPVPLSRNGARLHVGYVGQLGRGRGIELIVDLAAHRPDIDFHLVGGRPDDVERWRERTAELPNITFYGFRPHTETDRYRLAFDVALAPYQQTGDLQMVGWMSPLKLFEYMAAGRPVITTDLPVLREVVDEECAVLVNGGSLDAWLHALEALEAPEERRRVGAAARRRFEDLYTWDRRAELVLQPPE